MTINWNKTNAVETRPDTLRTKPKKPSIENNVRESKQGFWSRTHIGDIAL